MADLRAIAEAAKEAPGDWHFVPAGAGGIADGLDARDFAHIAVWSPDRALAALDVIEAARELAASVERWNESVTAVIGRQPKAHMGTEDVRAALDRWDALR